MNTPTNQPELSVMQPDFPDWSDMHCGVTVCDTEGTILFMNPKARSIYTDRGDLIGRNLLDCHNERSRAIIRELLDTGGSRAYTIEKRGIHKVIYQSAWFNDGRVAGLVELSMEVSDPMPHYIRG